MSRLKTLAVHFFAISCLISISANALSLNFRSGEHQTALIELYTSEGCSSCPPADRWLTSLKTSPKLWENFIPIAFHVDYWNYLGWDDRFAKAEYSQRQRQHKKEKNIRSVYTPGFVVNGQEWRGWFKGKRDLSGMEPKNVGVLELTVNNESFTANFSPTSPTDKKWTLTIAILGMDIVNQVDRGENAGRRLTHDFVTLAVAQHKESAPMQWQGKLPRANTGQAQAVVAWLSASESLDAIQAVGGTLAQAD